MGEPNDTVMLGSYQCVKTRLVGRQRDLGNLWNHGAVELSRALRTFGLTLHGTAVCLRPLKLGKGQKKN